MKIQWNSFIFNAILMVVFILILATWQINFWLCLVVTLLLFLLFMILANFLHNINFNINYDDDKLFYKQHKVIIPVIIIILYFIFSFISTMFLQINGLLCIFIMLMFTNFIYSLKRK
ncbi:hypothetical protein DY037_00195 [Apilactobacillus micheneri]|nr:hypothetical protein DY123_06330 [Apilactobacillus micheneri]TPR50407.1 hypothetical protein DY037_00195 [Apilactobacillus micheneri]TPR51050.1 hypothetical protein DY126_05785 [Apilactobacillus micheneri]